MPSTEELRELYTFLAESGPLCRAWRQICAWNRFLLRHMCSVRVHAVLAARGADGRPCLLPLVPLDVQESFAVRVFLAEIAAVPGWVPRSLAVS